MRRSQAKWERSELSTPMLFSQNLFFVLSIVCLIIHIKCDFLVPLLLSSSQRLFFFFFFALLERSLKFIDLLYWICVCIDSGDSGRIDYDERAILSLLDRTSSHDDAPDDEKDIMANEYLASFKVKQRFIAIIVLRFINNSWRQNKANYYREGGLDM